MTIRDMEIFSMVVECGHMRAAADRLFISASSVSQTIAAMEKELGFHLFERLERKLHLTTEGENVLCYIQDILGKRRQMEQYVKEISQGKHLLRVGATITVGTCVMQEIALALSQKGVEIRTVVDNTHFLEGMLVKNELDIALVEGDVRDKRLVTRPVIPDEMVAVCGREHLFAERKSVTAAELAAQPLILREAGSGTRAQLLEGLGSLGLSGDIVWSCSSPEAIKRAVVAGLGVTVISRMLVRAEIESGDLFCCGIEDLSLRRTFDIVYHRDKYLNAATHAFIESCEAYADNKKASGY